MRHYLFGAAVATSLFLVGASNVRAQGISTGLGTDPFSLYYGWYLPNQQFQAMQPRVEDTINNITAVRQFNGLADRAGIFDTASPFGGEEDLDPLRPYAPTRGGMRMGMMRPNIPGQNQAVYRGLGPTPYYNRLAQYYPSLRTVGHATNRNIAVIRSQRGSGMGGMGGGMGMGMGMPSPGPR